MTAIVPVQLSDPALEKVIAEGLAQVEAGLREAVKIEQPLLNEAAAHLIAGGKRLRPTLVLLAGQFGSHPDERIVPGAIAIELTHLATLYHDDVMDEAAVRHGRPSANARWDNTVAILTGDFLFSCASNVLAGLGAEAIRVQATTFAQLVSGQIAETLGPQPGQDPLEHYMKVVTDKTASLIATSGRFGAMFSDAPEGVAAGIAKACGAFGVAWQLADDILDVASETVQSGKTPGTDLRQGVRTLPVLYALRSTGQSPATLPADPSPADVRLRWLLDEADLTDEALLAEALTLLRGHHAMKESRADVLNWLHEARVSISALPDGPARAAFLALCDFVEKRTG